MTCSRVEQQKVNSQIVVKVDSVSNTEDFAEEASKGYNSIELDIDTLIQSYFEIIARKKHTSCD